MTPINHPWLPLRDSLGSFPHFPTEHQQENVDPPLQSSGRGCLKVEVPTSLGRLAQTSSPAGNRNRGSGVACIDMMFCLESEDAI